MCEKYPLFYEKSNFKGTFVHKIFDNDEFRTNYLKSINKDYVGFDFAKYKKYPLTEFYRDWETDRKSTRLNSSHSGESRMPSSA